MDDRIDSSSASPRSVKCPLRLGLSILALSATLSVAVPTYAEPRPEGRPKLGVGEPRKAQPFTREQRLLHAVGEGDEKTVRRALELGVSVHTRDDLGRSALLLAVRDARSLSMLRLLRENGARIDEVDAGGRSALSYAASLGRLELATYLCSEGAEVDRPDTQGRTPLFHAALWNQADLISALHERGAGLDTRDRHRATPLIAACTKDAEAAAKRLIALGANTRLVDRWGRSARDRAVAKTPTCLALSDPS